MTTHLRQTIRRLLKMCRRRGHSLDEAEDLIQEALLATEVYGRTHEISNPAAFLTTVVKNRSTNVLRRATRITSVPIRETGEDSEDVTVLIDPGSSPEAICSAEQQLRQIKSLLIENLGQTTCEVFLYQRSGHTYTEAAQKFHLTTRAVRGHITRAMYVLINHRAGER